MSMGAALVLTLASASWAAQTPVRQRVSFNADWRFAKGDPNGAADKLGYTNIRDWVLSSGVAFTKDPNFAHRVRPSGNLGADVAYTQPQFDDQLWRPVMLPHDWAIEGPFDPKAPGGTGKLPFAGIGWYRKHFTVPASDQDRQLYLDVDGAMSYANVWLNGQYVGGWPYGYASWRVDLTPYVKFGGENVIAIRLENPPSSSRWYPGGGIYRNVWLVQTGPVHVGHWGTYLTTPEVSAAAATVRLKVTVDNRSQQAANVRVSTQIFPLDAGGHATGTAVAAIAPLSLQVPPEGSAVTESTGTVAHPRLWGPPPQQQPHRYVAVTTIAQGDKVVDTYETPFGIRTLKFDPNEGFFINGEHILLNGVCNHHDLGALGTAVNYRALQRQLEMLRDMGCNALRTSHNPPAPELLELADTMGLLIMDEAFDMWVRQKTPRDCHLIFPDWGQQDLRAMVRRDRNCPSVILWSIGNEVGEQFTGDSGAALARKLSAIVHDEDPTRCTTTAMNVARATSPFAAAVDVVGLNYQGAGIRGAPGQFPAFHQALPDRCILSSETASALSSRGEYLFPVAGGFGAAVGPNSGQDQSTHQVSAYELYYAAFGASADKVFATQEQHPYVAGEFVWTGWDYLGEPTPFYSSRSSYSGIIDLAGFKKDRFYLYQAHWRPDLPMAHILPHWTWPQRDGQVTPVHVFTSGDEAELFLNGKSLGRKTKGPYEYRLRWDDVTYEPGELKVVAYKQGKEWATDVRKTAGGPARLLLQADRTTIAADGLDLAFVTITVADKDSIPVPRARNRIRFSLDGPGEIVATDNGDPTSFESFQSKERSAFNGLCLAIVRAQPGHAGAITLKAISESLQEATITLRSQTAPLEESMARTPVSAAPAPAPDRSRGSAGPAAGADRPVARTDQNSQIAHAQLLEKARTGGIDVYFEGDSITRRWGALDYPQFLAHWKQNFFGWNAANFGWGGDTTQNILWRLENGELDNVHPKVIVVLAGTNNVGSAPSRGDNDPRIADVTKGIKAILDLCRKKAPDSTIIVMGITPRNDGPGNPTGVMPVIARINENLAQLADGKKIRYVNIDDKLADAGGKLYDGMTVDRLHLSLKGYQVWADALKPILTERLGPPAQEDHAPPPTGDPSAKPKPPAPR
jgi:beta-galactosidase